MDGQEAQRCPSARAIGVKPLSPIPNTVTKINIFRSTMNPFYPQL
jgi:hypothetical protein